jgi:hypothetical protein
MAAEAQIFANRRLGRRIVLNLGHLYFDIVSDFDIRISDFNHSGCFMQNKPNFRKAKMNLNVYLTKTYENNLCSGLLENKPNTNPIKPNLVRHSLGEGGTNPNKPNTNPKTNPIKPNFKPSALSVNSFWLLLFFATSIIWQCRTGQYRSS